MRVHPLLAKHGRSALIILVGTVASLFLVRLTEAGTLSPIALPGPTMNTLASISDALIGSTFDSTAITADEHGSAIQVSKCVLLRMKGLSSPPDCP